MRLVDGRHRNEVIQLTAAHLDTGYWPSILSETLEGLLRKQAIQTLDEVARLMADEGAGLQRILAEKDDLQETLINSGSPGATGLNGHITHCL